MNKLIKRKWLRMLRSGKFKQVTGRLKNYYYNRDGEEDGIGYCCLGLLCELHADAKGHRGKLKFNSKFDFNEESGNLTNATLKWAGLPQAPNTQDEKVAVVVKYKGESITLARLNDSRYLSFKQIANVIERQL